MGTSAVVAVILIKEKHIVAAFRHAGATSPAAAMTPAALGVQERLAFAKLRRRAVLREAGTGRYYLDEPSWEGLRNARRRMALALGLLVLTAAVAGWLRG